jgi:type II secretory pathway pseudopilin PulG
MRVIKIQIFKEGGQSGVGLVSVLVALGILSIVVSLATIGINNVFAARKRMSAVRSAIEVEEAIVQNLIEGFKKYAELKCSNSSTFRPSMTFAPVSLDTNALGTLNSIYSGNSNFNRCSNTPFTSGSPKNASKFYLCYKVDYANNTTLDAESFAKNKGAFFEILINIKDLRSDSQVKCNNLAAGQNSGLGLEFYYTLHWMTKINQDFVPKSHTGSGNVAF